MSLLVVASMFDMDNKNTVICFVTRQSTRWECRVQRTFEKLLYFRRITSIEAVALMGTLSSP